ncbi:hypothetical protein [Pseudomonas fluorescens]|uniref:hypothetical protein n=1 Tax=Pseudomonas fluorescens TaxID=294 RepID=UPI003CFD50BB
MSQAASEKTRYRVVSGWARLDDLRCKFNDCYLTEDSMTNTRQLINLLIGYPSKWSYLIACTLWPVLFGIACWQTPQLAEFLKANGLNLTMMQIFWGGCGAYLFLLGMAPRINRRTHLRYEPEVIRFKLLSVIYERMVSSGTAESADLQVVIEEKKRISARLGFLLETENTYALQRILIRALKQAARFFKGF